MTNHMPISFKDGEFGYAPSAMFGGPVDGKRYKLPILPNGEVPNGFGHPIRQPHETSPVAYYARVTDEPIGGYHIFLFQETREPGGRRVLAETPVIETSAATDRTCEGYGAQPASRLRMLEDGE